MQVTLNFFMCRWFVFKPPPGNGLWRPFARFFVGIALFRLADWAFYTLLVSGFGLHYLAVQIFNVFLFAILKFRFSKSVMEK